MKKNITIVNSIYYYLMLFTNVRMTKDKKNQKKN